MSFLIGPSFYLMTISLVNGKVGQKKYYHFIIPILWLLIQIPFFLQSNDVKFNAWIDAYHPVGLSFRDVQSTYPDFSFNIIGLKKKRNLNK